MSNNRTGSPGGVHISVVASRYRIHPQTLRSWEREGLLTPSRSRGNTRLYGDADLRRLEVILHLTQDLGVNLAGVEVILHMRERLHALRGQVDELSTALMETHPGGATAGEEALVPLTRGSLTRTLMRLAKDR